MASSSQYSFASRYQQGRNLQVFIESLNDYDPQTEDISKEYLKQLLDKINQANEEETLLDLKYHDAVYYRRKAFFDSDNSALKLLSPILSSIQSQYSHDSLKYASVLAYIRKLRPSVKGKISVSELSFGAILQNFSHLINLLADFDDYKPINPLLTIEKLHDLIEKLQQLNIEVSTTYISLSKKRSERNKMYDDLKEISLRIKAYVKARYGFRSNQYDTLRVLKV